jgi:hypothetical protein
LFLFIWLVAEISQQALRIDALNQIWRPGYVGADEEVIKQMYHWMIIASEGLSDSGYFLVIYGFGIGSLLYGLALIKETGFAKWIGTSLLFIGLLSLCSFLRYYLGLDWLDAPVNFAYTWIYPYLQPTVRIAIGIWLLQEISIKYEEGVVEKNRIIN